MANFDNVKKVLDMYYNDNSNSNNMGQTIDHMMSFDEHKIVLTCLQDVLNKNIDGDVVEMGVFGGSTSIMIQKLLEFNNSNKKLHAYDSFEGFPQTNNNEDAGRGGRCGDWLLHQIEGELAFSLDNYVQNIENNNVKMPIINKGFFSDIPDNKYPDKMCFVFYDGDLYQSTLDALNKVYNKVVKNGTIVFDDFQHPTDMYPGVKKACLKYFNDDRVKFIGNNNILRVLNGGINDDYFFVPNEKVSQGILIKK